jgi:hypothetical protein
VCHSDSGSSSTSSSSSSEELAAAGAASGTIAGAGTTPSPVDEEHNALPDVHLSRSPITSTFVKGLSVFRAADVLSGALCVFEALGKRFRQLNVSTHPSRNSSFSSSPSVSGAVMCRVYTRFGVLRLKTVCLRSRHAWCSTRRT